MLYAPEFFEPLTTTRWSESRAREGIQAIVADVDGAMRGPKLLWRAHEWDRWRATSPMKNLYVGAAGVIWGLDALRRRGHAETKLDLPPLAVRTLELFRERPDFVKGWTGPEAPESGLMLGETGILLVTWHLSPSRQLESALLERVRANVRNEADELFWATPGTLHAALAMHEATGNDRWRRAWLESADALWSRRGDDGLWVQRLYGRESKGLSASHGLVGNVLALLRGGKLLAPARRRALVRDSNAILARTALREGKRANWPHRVWPELYYPDGRIRVQWCSGGAGILVSTADFLEEELILAGAELVWKAGPHGLEKAGASATALPATAMPCSKRSHGRETSAGSPVRGGSRCTRWSRSCACEPSAAGAATRCGRATSGSRSSPPTASMPAARIPSSIPGCGEPQAAWEAGAEHARTGRTREVEVEPVRER